MKKAICLILCLLTLTAVLTIVPVSAKETEIAAAGDLSGTTGDCTWTYSADTKTLRVSGSGAMADVEPNDAINNLQWKQAQIENVIIENGVTRIGNYSFYFQASMKQLSIADSVRTIGKNAFANCKGLSSLKLPKNLETIEEAAFYWCDRLDGELVIPDNTVDIEKEAFRGCRNLDKLTLGAKTETLGDYAFCDCICLEYVDCKELVTIGSYAFYNCLKMLEADISSVQVIHECAFRNCILLSLLETSPDLFLAAGAFNGSYLKAIVILSRTAVLDFGSNGADTLPENTTIYGYSGSSAERYATKYNRKFVAIADNDVTIKKVELSVTAPAAGQKPSYEATIPASYANQYQIDEFSSEDGTWTDGVAWYDITDGKRITPDETFKGGHQYEVCAYLLPKRGYRFYFSQNGTAGGTINGNEAKFEYNKPDTRNPMIFYDFPTLEKADTPIAGIDVNVESPEAGEKISFTAATTSEEFRITDVNWYEIGEGDPVMITGDEPEFEGGKTYMVQVMIGIGEGYTVDDNTAVTVNGESAQLSVTVGQESTACEVCYIFPKLEKPIICGDADGDGIVNIYDASVIQMKLADLKPTSYVAEAADANNDGAVNIYDASEIQRYLAGLKAYDGIGKPVKS